MQRSLLVNWLAENSEEYFPKRVATNACEGCFKSWSTEGLELRGWVNGPKWRNCWMAVTPISLTSKMSLSWSPRYTSIYELNKIINSPNILRLSSLVLASSGAEQLQLQSRFVLWFCIHDHWQCRIKIRCALYLAFEWRTQTWYLNLYSILEVLKFLYASFECQQ